MTRRYWEYFSVAASKTTTPVAATVATTALPDDLSGIVIDSLVAPVASVDVISSSLGQAVPHGGEDVPPSEGEKDIVREGEKDNVEEGDANLPVVKGLDVPGQTGVPPVEESREVDQQPVDAQRATHESIVGESDLLPKVGVDSVLSPRFTRFLTESPKRVAGGLGFPAAMSGNLFVCKILFGFLSSMFCF